MRTITVNGKGRVSAAPDCIQLTMTLEARDAEYGAAMEKAARQIAALQEAVAPAGFAEGDLKTADFSVRADYESVQDDRGRWKQEFRGYVCVHVLNLRFPLDMQRLSTVLNAVSGVWAGASETPEAPQLQIAFTVLDPDALRGKLLQEAAADARRNALVLCEASGVRLGELESIRYDPAGLDVRSPTRMETANAAPRLAAKAAFDESFAPEEIKVSETAVFVWDIE